MTHSPATGVVNYETVAEAYRDLEQASGRLALTDRLATLLAATPAELLPTVCYLCQGLIAPEFAGVDLGLAEKLAVVGLALLPAGGDGGDRPLRAQRRSDRVQRGPALRPQQCHRYR